MAAGVQPARPRLESIDLVRGLIMIVMALDHTRDFFGMPGANPTNLATATAGLFFTRWITHFCAPVFALLTGAGAALSLGKKSIPELSRYLWTRGLWLIFLELVVLRCLAYQFNVDYHVTLMLVLWSLGWSMITLSALVRLPVSIVAGIGALLIVGHNAFDQVRLDNPLWTFLYAQGFLVNSPRFVLFNAYPLVPWIGVTAVGFALGRIYAGSVHSTWNPDRRRALLVRLGIAMTAAFVILRTINLYGDPSRWKHQSTTLFTVLSFLNTTKQPASLLFLLMTLGPALLLLWVADRGTPTMLRPALSIGRVPLFYYIGHFFLIHLLAVVVCYARYGAAHWIFESPDLGNYPFTPPPGWGFSLPIVYGVWIAVVLTMYPMCRWFAALKQRRNDWWLSYL